MRSRLFPVIFTAALTSVMTMFAVAHFQHTVPYLTVADSKPPVQVKYASFDNNAAGSPVNFEGAAESSVRAVVHIKTATKARLVTSDMDDVFSRMFGQQQYYIPPSASSGSGVVVSADGYVVTNNHVVADANEVTVTFNDGRTSTAKVVGTDPSTDIAVLKVEGNKTLNFMEFGNSDDVKLGQWVLAVGYPLNLDATVTAGIVSAKGRSIGINRETSGSSAIESYIQTDAAVNPGNSGGALVNTSGQLVGINSAIASPTGSYAGYSYAIPSNIVRKAVNDLMKYGSVQRAYMGIRYVDLRNATPDQLTKEGIDYSGEGVYVMEVVASSGAAKAGIKKGDIIMQINGVATNTTPELQGQIARYQPGDNVSVVYSRGGKSFTTNVQLAHLDGTTAIVNAESTAKLLGASFRPLSDNEKSKYNIKGGVLVTDVGKGSIAKQTQMNKGFVITGINNAVVSSINDLELALGNSKTLQIAGFYPGRAGMYYYGLNNVDALNAEE